MNRLILSVLLFLIIFPFAAHAQKLKGIGVVDFAYIVSESKAGAQAQAESKAFEQSLNAQLLPMRDELLAIQADFKARETKMKEAEKAAIATDFQAKSAAFDNQTRAFTAAVQQKNKELSEKIISEVKAVISEIVREKKINMVVDINTVLFSEEIPDLTEEVLIRYNLRYVGK